jgi:CRISPR-associated protein Csh1
MLTTLSKIGEQLLGDKDIWARLTIEPKYNPEKKNWVCPILFDCINKEIKVLKEDMELFKPEESANELNYLAADLWGRRGKKCALTVEIKNFTMLEETLLGKKNGESGSMLRSIKEFDSNLVQRQVYIALMEINEKLEKNRADLDFKKIKEELDLGNKDEVVLFYSMVLADNINEGRPVRITALEGYEDFIIRKFGTSMDGHKGIDFVSGNLKDEVVGANFTGRYNIHKIFQTTSLNYASGFSDFKKNFQITPATTAELDKASAYILNKWQTRIAGISHIVVPTFLHRDLEELDITETEFFLHKSSDLLFRYQSLEADINKELPETNIFWVNYIAFESDGNSFKIINHIKDVNSRYLSQLIETFDRAGIEFKNFIGGRYLFNLQSVYNLVPVRDSNKSKVNPALRLFKDILEQKPIDPDVLFNHFIHLILCHWYGRYSAFKNIRPTDSFDFAVKDAVFKYSTLIYALKQLNLLKMENEIKNENEHIENSKSDFQQRMEAFFEKMDYTETEKALFYLGRVLSSVAYAQHKKGHESKPVLNKINFNGMDAAAIVRFSLDLREKARQYNIHRETDWDFGRFTDRFNEKNWTLGNEQNVFYLMAGYSFALTKSNNN